VIRTVVLLISCLHAAALLAGPPVYEEQSGRVVMEVESHPPTGAWVPQKKFEGYTGAGYYTWGGPNVFRSPGNGVLSYAFVIKTPGTYQLRIRNRHDFHDSTEQNDCFTRIDGGNWVKTFSSKRGEWTFRSNHEHGHNRKPQASYELKAGRHILQISGRSQGFSIDRIHLYRQGDRGAEDASLPETRTAAAKRPPSQPAAAPGRAPNLGTRLALAKRFTKSNNTSTAKRVLKALIEKYPDAPEAREAALLLEQLNSDELPENSDRSPNAKRRDGTPPAATESDTAGASSEVRICNDDTGRHKLCQHDP